MTTNTEELADQSAPTTAATASAPGFGERLRNARENAGLSPAQAADKLHCDVQVVHFLEAENVTALGAAVYARGHLRRYADLLRLSTPELVALYDQKNDRPDSIPDLTRISRAERPRDPNNVLRWVYVVGGGLVSLFAVWAVLQNPRVSSDTTTTPVPVAATPFVVQPPVSAPPPATAPVPEATAAGAGGTVVAAPAGAPTASAAVVPSTVAAAAMQPTNKMVKLALRASKDCWTEVYDVDGRQLFFDIARRGSRQEVSGNGPLRLVLGNALVMRLEIGDKEIVIPAELQRKGTAFVRIAADGRVDQAR